mgnify:CR=1 FL=1
MARGLAYLHQEVQPAIIHRDIKASNILLDTDWNACVADFGLAKFTPEGATHLTTRVAGTQGYVAPEYVLYGQLTEKSDVYSYGVVLLELLTGRRATLGSEDNMDVHKKTYITGSTEHMDLVRWVTIMARSKEDVWTVMDTRLDIMEEHKESIVSLLKIALLCTSSLPQRRPSMREVVELLNEATPVHTTHSKLLRSATQGHNAVKQKLKTNPYLI